MSHPGFIHQKKLGYGEMAGELLTSFRFDVSANARQTFPWAAAVNIY